MEMKNQRGAIVVEATVALTAFIFAIFTILSVVNICYIQAKIGIALNSATKELSQYSYLYYFFKVDELESAVSSGTADSETMVKNTITGVDKIVTALDEDGTQISVQNFENLYGEIDEGVTILSGEAKNFADALTDDPKAFIKSMGKLALSQVTDEIKGLLAQSLARAFMQKNLVSTLETDNPDAFLKRYNIEQGLDGLDFDYSAFLVGGTSNEIQLVVTYEIKVVRLLNIDVTFKIRQCSKTTAWGNGVSIIDP